jgi:hypothetical protein
MKIYKLLLSLSVMALLVTACSKEKKEEQPDLSCKISGSLAPMWVCTGDDFNPNTISAVGVAPLIGGKDFQRKVALANGRTSLLKKISAKDQRITKKELNSINLINSKIVNQWIEPKKSDLYLLVATPTPQILR